MKNLIYLFMAFLLVMGCQPYNRMEAILRQAETVIDLNADSALLLLKTIEEEQLDAEQRARYQLLETWAQWKTGTTLESDSLISASVAFYVHSDDLHHRAMAYCCRGAVRLGLRRIDESVADLAQADSLADSLADDWLAGEVGRLLSDAYTEQGDLAAAMAARMKGRGTGMSLTMTQWETPADSSGRERQARRTAMWVSRMDDRQQQRQHSEAVAWALGVLGVAILGICSGSWLYRRKMNRFRSIIDERTRQMVDYQREIERLEASGEAHEQQLAELKRKINERQEKMSLKLHIGTKVYEQMKRGESISDASGADLQCLVEYFALLRPRLWYQWENRYNALTPKQIVFLILQEDLCFGDSTIEKVMGIKNTAVRSMRSRIKSRESGKP